MKKILIALGLILISLLSIGGCKIETGTSFGLNIEGSLLATLDREGKLTPIPRGVFKRGEKVCLILLDVGKFKKGKDGRHWLNMDIEVKLPNGTIIFSKEGLFEEGHTILENDIASTPYGCFSTVSEYGLLKAGEYRIKLTIYDRISDTSASKSKTLTLE